MVRVSMTKDKFDKISETWHNVFCKQLKNITNQSSNMIERDTAQYIIEAVIKQLCSDKLNYMVEEDTNENSKNS